MLLGTFLLILLLGFLNLRGFLIKLSEGDETPNIVVLVQPNQTQPEAAETIVTMWLEYFKTRQYVSAIDDFRIILRQPSQLSQKDLQNALSGSRTPADILKASGLKTSRRGCL